ADANKVAMPANWPNNELVGDEVIVPPATSISEAQERLKKYKCYDWWFCHKKV
ncbi:MAG: peroxiredoxin, partial [Candidatus Njordarchaeota archaeon]